MPQTTQKYSIPDFIAAVREQNPEYANSEDAIVLRETLLKYPEYKEQIDFNSGPLNIPLTINYGVWGPGVVETDMPKAGFGQSFNESLGLTPIPAIKTMNKRFAERDVPGMAGAATGLIASNLPSRIGVGSIYNKAEKARLAKIPVRATAKDVQAGLAKKAGQMMKRPPDPTTTEKLKQAATTIEKFMEDHPKTVEFAGKGFGLLAILDTIRRMQK